MADTEDFATLLAEQGRIQPKKLRLGERLRARIVHVGKETVFFALSPTQEGALPKVELMNPEGEVKAAVGDELDVVIVGLGDEITLARQIGRDQINTEMLEEARSARTPVDGTVTGVNKGGLEVSLGSARGFCPIGQADVSFVAEPQSLIGKNLQFLVREVREGGRNVLLSRRAFLEIDQKRRAEELLSGLKVGDRREGTVTRVVDFGAFVDLGGLEGLVPVAELTFSRDQRPTDLVKPGERVLVEVKRIEPDPKIEGRMRISLSMKATQPDPWVQHSADLHEGALLKGRVSKVEKFGAFVALFPGVEGLVHISELADRRVRHPSDVVTVGQEIEVRILSMSPSEHRIGLSLKAAGNNPAPRQGESTEHRRERDEDQQLLATYRGQAGGLGTFGDLLKTKSKK